MFEAIGRAYTTFVSVTGQVLSVGLGEIPAKIVSGAKGFFFAPSLEHPALIQISEETYSELQKTHSEYKKSLDEQEDCIMV